METEKKQDSEFVNFAHHAAGELLRLKEEDSFSRLFYLVAIDLKDNPDGLVLSTIGGGFYRIGVLLAGCFSDDMDLATVAFSEWLKRLSVDDLRSIRKRLDELIEKCEKEVGSNG